MTHQYVACKFRPDDRRTYTYHFDGEPLVAGDEVKIAGRGDEGWQRVYVVSVTDEAPPFDTKPILEKIVAEQPDLLSAGDGADLEAHLENRP